MNEFKSLRKNWEFQAVYRNGKSKANRCFVMIIKKNDASSNRRKQYCPPQSNQSNQRGYASSLERD